MPPHYPSFYDYADEDTDGINIPRPTATEAQTLSPWIIAGIVGALLVIPAGVAAYFYSKFMFNMVLILSRKFSAEEK